VGTFFTLCLRKRGIPVRLPISTLPGDYSIVKLPSGSDIPHWVDRSSFYSISDTGDEFSVVCAGGVVPEGYIMESGMKLFRIDKKLEFSETGIISSIALPLAESGISIFVISTFNTDYFLIRKDCCHKAAEILREYHDIDSHAL